MFGAERIKAAMMGGAGGFAGAYKGGPGQTIGSPAFPGSTASLEQVAGLLRMKEDDLSEKLYVRMTDSNAKAHHLMHAKDRQVLPEYDVFFSPVGDVSMGGADTELYGNNGIASNEWDFGYSSVQSRG